jgi:hypothetical protein
MTGDSNNGRFRHASLEAPYRTLHRTGRGTLTSDLPLSGDHRIARSVAIDAHGTGEFTRHLRKLNPHPFILDGALGVRVNQEVCAAAVWRRKSRLKRSDKSGK